MASTFTNTGIEKPGSGDYSNTWDVPANRDFDIIDELVSGVASIPILDANTTLTVPDGTTSDNRKMVLVFTGTLTANRDVTFAPADMTKFISVTNATTGGFSLVLKQGAAAATVTLQNGKSTVIYCDGSDEVKNALDNFQATSVTATTVAATTLTVGGQNAVPANRTISAAGGGLSGGGDLSANRTITLDVSAASEDTAPDMDADFVLGYDTSGTANAKVKMVNYIPQLDRKGADITAAATLVKPTEANIGLWHDITGNTGISAFWNDALNRLLFVRFTGTPTLTHNATSLILPGGANITAAAGDRAIFYNLTSGNWICVDYVRASGQPVTQIATASIADDAVTYAKIQNVTDVRLLGRAAGSPGDVQEITVSGLTLSAGVLSSSGNTPAFLVNKGGTDQTGINSQVTITWPTEVIDTGGYFASNTFTPLVSGTYLFLLNVNWGIGSAGEDLQISIAKNGTDIGIAKAERASTAGISQSVWIIASANGTTDAFTATATGGSSDTVRGNTNESYFAGFKII